jgi:hypothetical protein
MSGNILAFLALCLLTGAGVYAGHCAELRVREAQALSCARNSDGTDMAIAQCYIDRDLPLPSAQVLTHKIQHSKRDIQP